MASASWVIHRALERVNKTRNADKLIRCGVCHMCVRGRASLGEVVAERMMKVELNGMTERMSECIEVVAEVVADFQSE